MIFFSFLFIFFTFLLFLYLAFPIIIRFYPHVILHGVFMNKVCPPSFIHKLSQPKAAYGLYDADNLYIPSPQRGKIGLWKMPPKLCEPPNYDDPELPTCKVILYCHGNSFHRGFGHRLRHYELLRSLGFWVITFDYRGYGDSTGYVSEEGAVDDIITVYKWLVKEFPSAINIIVWGHSLGTALSTRALCDLQFDNEKCAGRLPDGLVLEAPFNSMDGIMVSYPLTKLIFQIYPKDWITGLIKVALNKININLNTEECLSSIICPVLILHAKDDLKVPHKLGRCLFDKMQSPEQSCSSRSITFVSFDESHKLGHSGIYQNNELPNLIKAFLGVVNSERISEKFIDLKL